MNSQRKKILFVITKSVWGGSQKYVFDLTTHLSPDLYEPAVALGGGGPLTEKLIQSNIPVYRIKSFQRNINLLKDITSFFELLALFLQYKPDIIHSNSSKSGGIAGVAAFIYHLISRKKIRRVFTVHGWAFHEPRPNWQLLLIRIASRISALLQDTIICVSLTDRRSAIKNNIVGPQKIVTIHNGIMDTSFYPRTKAQKELFCAEYKMVIGTIGEWTRNKGHTYLIQAMPEILKIHPEIKLCLIGWGEKKSDLELKIKKLELENSVLLISRSPALLYLKAFDIFVLPSLKEGLPYVLLEAGLAELPMIATNVGGIPEIITDKATGILIPPASTRVLVESLRNIIEHKDLQLSLGTQARKDILKHFSLEKMLRETEDVYVV